MSTSIESRMQSKIAGKIPRVSVICAFYNAEQFIAEAIESVVSQDYDEWELLLCDDGSNDTSTAIAREYEARFPDRIRYFEHAGHANLTQGPTRNMGLTHATGEYVAFIDADDVWLPGKVSAQVRLLDDYTDCAMVCGKVRYWGSWEGGTDEVRQTGNLVDAVLQPPQALWRLHPIGVDAAPGPSEVMIRREVLERVGGFEPSVPSLFDDQSCFLKIYLEAPVYFSGMLFINYRLHSSSCTSITEQENSERQKRNAFFAWFVAYLKRNADPFEGRILKAAERELMMTGGPLRWAFWRRLRNLRQKLRHASARKRAA